jgi:hypothetical protein
MHIPAIRDHDIALGEGNAIEPLAAFLAGQLDKAEAFGRKIQDAVQPPHPIVVLRLFPGFRDRCPVGKPDAPSLRRRLGAAAEQ